MSCVHKIFVSLCTENSRLADIFTFLLEKVKRGLQTENGTLMFIDRASCFI